MTRFPADEPDFVDVRLAVDEQIAVPGDGVLTDASVDLGRASGSWSLVLRLIATMNRPFRFPGAQ